jgi:uncharacterized protein (UPF0333 family)
MKKLLIVTALGLVISSQAYAAGSTITNSTIRNKATVTNSTNTAGSGAEANMGVVKIKNSSVRNSTISNDATIRNSTNRASGGSGGFLGAGSQSGGKANMGAVIVE